MALLPALVLFSGGQDSTTCLAWALERFSPVETVGFNYGQRHIAELEARPKIRARLGEISERWQSRLGDDHLLPIDTLKAIGRTAMTDEIAFRVGRDGLPNTFVPGRNLFFLTAAAAIGYRRAIHDLVGGMCETDYSGYPDCRNDTLVSMQQTLTLGLASDVRVHTPLMRIDKAATWSLAKTLGGDDLVQLIVEETVTCYRADRTHRHDWGYGCSDCPACVLRARGFAKFISA